MEIDDFNKMLLLVAQAYETTPEILQQNILSALENPMAGNADAPHTVEEYVAYLAQTLPHPFTP